MPGPAKQLTPKQIKFAQIMSMMPQIPTNSSNRNEIVPRLPICYNDIRSWYIRGKYSVFENLPHPKVEKFKDTHIFH